MRAWTEIGCGFGRGFCVDVAVGVGLVEGVAVADGAAEAVVLGVNEGVVPDSSCATVQPPSSRPRINKPRPGRVTSRLLPDRTSRHVNGARAAIQR